MAEDREKEIEEQRKEAEKQSKEYDSWAEENGLPTNEEIEEARNAGRQSGLYFGTGTGTSAGDFPLNTADSLQKQQAVNDAIANNEAIVVDTQPGGSTVASTTSDLSDEEREELDAAGVRDPSNPEQVGTADSSVADRNPVLSSPVDPTATYEQTSENQGQFGNDADENQGGDSQEEQRSGNKVIADIKQAETTEEVDRLEAERNDLKGVRDAAATRREQLDAK